MKWKIVLSVIMMSGTAWGMKEEDVAVEFLDEKTIQELGNIIGVEEKQQMQQVNIWTKTLGLKDLIMIAHKADELGMTLVADLLCNWIGKNLNYVLYGNLLSGKHSQELQSVISMILHDIYKKKRLKIEKEQLTETLLKKELFLDVVSWFKEEKEFIANVSLSFLIKVLLLVKGQLLNEFFFGDYSIVQDIFVEKLSNLEEKKSYNSYVEECKNSFLFGLKEPLINMPKVRLNYYKDSFKKSVSFLYIVESFPKQAMNIVSFGTSFYEKIKNSLILTDYKEIIAEMKDKSSGVSTLKHSVKTLQNLIRKNFIVGISQQYCDHFKINEPIVADISHLKLDDIIEEKINNCGLKSFVDVNEKFFEYIKKQIEWSKTIEDVFEEESGEGDFEKDNNGDGQAGQQGQGTVGVKQPKKDEIRIGLPGGNPQEPSKTIGDVFKDISKSEDGNGSEESGEGDSEENNNGDDQAGQQGQGTVGVEQPKKDEIKISLPGGNPQEPSGIWSNFTGWLNKGKNWLWTLLGVGATTVGGYYVWQKYMHKKRDK